MRELNFRCWHSEEQVMYYIKKETYLSQSAIVNPYVGHINSVWMQYTGLKDKKGKEIYEGDIVQIKDHAFQGAMDIDGNYEVFYNDYMELCCGSLILVRQRPYITVIGNKYENPELLEVQNASV